MVLGGQCGGDGLGESLLLLYMFVVDAEKGDAIMLAP